MFRFLAPYPPLWLNVFRIREPAFRNQRDKGSTHASASSQSQPATLTMVITSSDGMNSCMFRGNLTSVKQETLMNASQLSWRRSGRTQLCKVWISLSDRRDLARRWIGYVKFLM